MKLEEEIRELYGGVILENMGANNHELWLQMYRGEYPYLNADTVSLNLACTIATELARTATLELKSEVTSAGNKTEELNKIYQLLIEDVRRLTEYGLALGGIIIKPLEVAEGVLPEGRIVKQNGYSPDEVKGLEKYLMDNSDDIIARAKALGEECDVYPYLRATLVKYANLGKKTKKI